MTVGRRRPLLAAPLVALLLGLGACGDDEGDEAATDGEPEDATSTTTDGSSTTGSEGEAPLPTVAPPPRPDVTFDASITSDTEALDVRFSLRNDGDDVLIVVNGADEAGDAPPEDTAPLYAVAGDEEGTVELSSRTFPMDVGENATVYTAFTLPVTRAEPGATVEDEYRVPLPLVGRHPYDESLDLPPLGEVEQVEFCLGVLPESEATSLAEGDEGALTLEHIGEPAESVLCSEPVALD